ncbi:MAG: hypothetical protein AAF581_15260 [Planctomycetota bacterium]
MTTLAFLFCFCTATQDSSDTNAPRFEAVAPWSYLGFGHARGMTPDGARLKLGDNVYDTKTWEIVGSAPGHLAGDGETCVVMESGSGKVSSLIELKTGKKTELTKVPTYSIKYQAWDLERMHLYTPVFEQAKRKPSKSKKPATLKWAIQKWDLKKQKKLKTWKPPKGLGYRTVALSDDGKLLFVLLKEGSLAKHAAVLKTKSLKGKMRADYGDSDPLGGCFDGKRLLTSYGTKSRWYDIDSGEFSRGLNISSLSERVIADDSSGVVLSHNTLLYRSQGPTLAALKPSEMHPLIGLNRFSAVYPIDGTTRVLGVMPHGAVIDYDFVSEQAKILRQPGHLGGGLEMRDFDGKTYVTCIAGRAYCYDSTTKELLWNFAGGLLNSGVTSAVGNRIVYRISGRVAVYEPPAIAPVAEGRSRAGTITCWDADPQGRFAMYAINGRRIEVWSADDATIKWQKKIETTRALFSGDGNRVIALTRDGYGVYGSDTGTLHHSYEIPKLPYGANIAVNKDGSRLWAMTTPNSRSALGKGKLVCVNLEKGKIVFEKELYCGRTLALHPNDRHLLVHGAWEGGRRDGTLFVLDAATHEPVWSYGSFSESKPVSWTADGSKMRYVTTTLYELPWSAPQ